MKITKNWQVGCIAFLISLFSAGLSACCIEQLSAALGTVLGVGFALIAFLLCIIGIYKTFDEKDFLDRNDLDNPITIQGKFFFFIALLCFGCFGVQVFKPTVSMYNTNINYTNQYEKVQQERKMFYDKMWKTYLTKNNICELNRETFIEVTSIIMQGRSDGQNVSWKIVHENQPISYEQFSSFYADLSNFVTKQREDYYKLENQALGIIQQQNAMLDSFPNNVYNKVLKLERLEYQPGFTSTRTNKIFESGIEDL